MTEKSIEAHQLEHRSFAPSKAFSAAANVGSVGEYEEMYARSVGEPEAFWEEQAGNELAWHKKWSEVLEYDFDSIGRKEGAYVNFFKGGELNVSYNCLDRHLETQGTKTAIIWQGEKEEDKRTLSYQELHKEVCRFANVLKKHGVVKGTTVTLYMPMVPELPVAMLACARIGAIHSVVFSAFSADALKHRIQDCGSEVVVTSDVGFHAGKTVPLKANCDKAVAECPTVKSVFVLNRGNTDVQMWSGRDYWWHEECQASEISDDCEPEWVESETPLYILYTSGSTGKPKGVLHTSAGYLLYAHLTYKYVFDHKPDDIYWCTADIGWVTGHSYLVYGPLSNAATTVMFEGTPTYPEADRFWKIVEDYKVSVFYTAPTALRSLMRLGDEWPKKHDLSSLRLLGTVGEPINPEAWMWYYELIGGGRCPVVDTWWQTETGGMMITTLPGAHATKPSSAGKPFFGIKPEILDDDGKPVEQGTGGSLAITNPWPGMIRGVYGDPKNELVRNVYFSRFPGKYFTGDGCRQDGEGYYWLLGRIDDVLNVSAHRFATAELEATLNEHEAVVESAVVGFPHETKGQGIYCYVTLKQGFDPTPEIETQLTQHLRSEIGPIAKPDKIQFSPALPKTRSGKIMRRILRKIAAGDVENLGDTSTLADPSVVETLVSGATRDGLSNSTKPNPMLIT